MRPLLSTHTISSVHGCALRSLSPAVFERLVGFRTADARTTMLSKPLQYNDKFRHSHLSMYMTKNWFKPRQRISYTVCIWKYFV